MYVVWLDCRKSVMWQCTWIYTRTLGNIMCSYMDVKVGEIQTKGYRSKCFLWCFTKMLLIRWKWVYLIHFGKGIEDGWRNICFQFSFENCKFRIQKSKEGTGRVVVWMMGVANSYTMEASFGGSELGSRMSTHFSVQDYESLGKTFCETLLDFYDDDPSKERLRNKIVARLLKEGSNADEPTNIDLSDYSR